MTMEGLDLSLKPEVRAVLTRTGRFLIGEGIQSYVVGGLVRDMLLGRGTADIDIAVAADALEVARRVAAAFGGKYVPLDEANGIGRVVLLDGSKAGWELDFSTLRGSIEADLAERDFSIDAMAFDLGQLINEITPSAVTTGVPPGSLALIDPFGGRNDLRRGSIRAVSETIFRSDAARLLRAVRLAAELDFTIDGETEALVREDAHLIGAVAGERVREELLRILALRGAGRYLGYLDGLGLLTALVPELDRAKGVSQPHIHFWDVFQHSLNTVTAVDFLLRQGGWEYGGEEVLAVVPWSAQLSEHFDQAVGSGSTRRALLKLAALLHDVAKPQTKTVDEDGRARFLGHPGEGATIAAGILERLRFSTRETNVVALMVKHHLRVGQMSHYEVPTRRAIYRYFRDTGEAGIGILFLSLADHLATRGPNLDLVEWRRHAQVVEYVLAQYFAEKSLVAPPRLIDGHDLLDLFGLRPGPKVGELLEAVREAQAAGEVTTREAALAYVHHLLSAPTAGDK